MQLGFGGIVINIYLFLPLKPFPKIPAICFVSLGTECREPIEFTSRDVKIT